MFPILANLASVTYGYQLDLVKKDLDVAFANLDMQVKIVTGVMLATILTQIVFLATAMSTAPKN